MEPNLEEFTSEDEEETTATGFDAKYEELLDRSILLDEVCLALGIQTNNWHRLCRAGELAQLKLERLKLEKAELQLELEITTARKKREFAR